MTSKELKEDRLYIIKSPFNYLNNNIIQPMNSNSRTLYYKVVEHNLKSSEHFHYRDVQGKMDHGSPNALKSNFIDIGSVEDYPEYFI